MDERARLELEDEKRRERSQQGNTPPNSATRRSERIHSKEQGSTHVDDGTDANDARDGKELPDGPSPSLKSGSRRVSTAMKFMNTPPKPTPRGSRRIRQGPIETELDLHLPSTSPRGRQKKSILKCVPEAAKEVEVPAFPTTFKFDSPVRTNAQRSVRVQDTTSVPFKSKPVPKPTIQPLAQEVEEPKNVRSPVIPDEKPATPVVLPEKPGTIVVPPEQSEQPEITETTFTVPATEENRAPPSESEPAPDVKVLREVSPQAPSEPEQTSIFDPQNYAKQREREARKQERKAAKQAKEPSPPPPVAETAKPGELTEETVIDEGDATIAPPEPLHGITEEEVLDGEDALPVGDDEIVIVNVDSNKKVMRDDGDRMGNGKEVMTEKRKSVESVEEDIDARTPSKEGSEVGTEEEDNSHEKVPYNESHVKNIFENFLSKLGIVMLSYNGITDAILAREIIPKIDNLRLVQEVRLSRNTISKLPDSFIPSAKRARCLTLTSNKIKRLPRWFCEECALPLKQLFLSSNELLELPKDMAKLQYLEVLDVSNNYLREIPVGLGELRMVKILNLSHNELTSLPKDIGAENERLLCLDISDNEDFYAPLPPLLERRACSMEDLFLECTKLQEVLKKKEREASTRELILQLSAFDEEELQKRLEEKAANEENRKKRLSRRSVH